MDHWMRDLPNNLKSLSLNKLTVPGTHNSGAYRLDLAHGITNSSSQFSKAIKVVQTLRDLPGLAAIIGSITLCQSCDIYQQLMMGVRYFDFRLSYFTDNKSNQLLDHLYITHTFTCIQLRKVLLDIVTFTATHPEEILILNFEPDSEHKSTFPAPDSVFNLLQEQLATYLVPTQSNFPSFSLADLNNLNKNIILFYNNYTWNSSLINNIWFNTNSLSDLEKGINNYSFTANYNGCSAFLTPEVNKATDILKLRSLKNMATAVWNNLFAANKIINAKNFSVILFDHMNETKVKYIIELNQSSS